MKLNRCETYRIPKCFFKGRADWFNPNLDRNLHNNIVFDIPLIK